MSTLKKLASWFRSNNPLNKMIHKPEYNYPRAAAGPSHHVLHAEHIEHTETAIGPPPLYSKHKFSSEDVDIEELRRLDPEGFQRRWNSLEPRARIAEDLVDVRLDLLRTAGVRTADRTDSRVDGGRTGDGEKGKGRAVEESEGDGEDLMVDSWAAERYLDDPGLVNEKGKERIRGSEAVASASRPPIKKKSLVAVTRDCVICTNELFVLEFPMESTTAACKHPIQACKECLASWLASELADKGHSRLTCPECSEALSYNDVWRASSQETFAVYDRLTTQTALTELPDFAWCLAPKCGNGQLNSEHALANFMRCAACKYEQCLKHCTKWHWQESCEEYDYRLSGRKATSDEAKTLAMLDSVSKVCPGSGCKWRLQKVDGCDQ
jgi:hypothetical protein